MCISVGGSVLGHIDISTLYSPEVRVRGRLEADYWDLQGGLTRPEQHRREEQAARYLLDVEMEGCVDGHLYTVIASKYRTYEERSSKVYYYRLAAEMGHAPAYLLMARDLCNVSTKDNALLVLMEAVEKGVRDERILDEIHGYLCDEDYTPSRRVLGKFKNKEELELYYLDVMEHRQSGEAEDGYKLTKENWLAKRASETRSTMREDGPQDLILRTRGRR